MSLLKKKLIHKLKINSKTKVAIIGTSICSCILGEKLKLHFGANIVFYEKTKFLGGAWRSDKFGNIFSNIIAPTNKKEKRIFLRVLNFFKTLKITPKKNSLKSLYSRKIVDSYSINFNSFLKNSKKKHKLKNLGVKSLIEKKDYVLINNKYKFDYVFFPNYIDLKKIKIYSSSNDYLEIPPRKKIKSKHIRILCKNKQINKWNNIFYSEKSYGVVDRLQIIEIKKNLFKISGRVSLDYKTKSKKYLIDNLSKKIGLKNIISSRINTYLSVHYNLKDIIKLNRVNKRSNRIRHFDTSSVLGFVNNYFL